MISTDKPVKYVFNTHAHGDHTGGNIKFLPSATIIAHRNARAAMIQGKQPGPPQAAVPVATHEFTLPARAQAAVLGRPDFDAVYVEHPIQDRTSAEIEAPRGRWTRLSFACYWILIPKTHDITTIYFFTRSECFGDNSSVALHCLRRSL